MKRIFVAALAAPLAMLAAQPALAADDFRELGAAGSRRAGFAGIQLRMSLGEDRPAPPTARLALGVTHYGATGATLQRGSFTPTLELGLTRTGRADLHVAGQRLTDVQRRLGIAPVAAAIVGIAAAGAAVMVVAASSGDDEDDLDKVQCFIPEKELCGKPM
ncbi:MAG TPA: hypothetical protein VGB08_00970, partial [Allosphingosinicella sp.]|jgi:hypothetical protein